MTIKPRHYCIDDGRGGEGERNGREQKDVNDSLFQYQSKRNPIVLVRVCLDICTSNRFDSSYGQDQRNLVEKSECIKIIITFATARTNLLPIVSFSR